MRTIVAIAATILPLVGVDAKFFNNMRGGGKGGDLRETALSQNRDVSILFSLPNIHVMGDWPREGESDSMMCLRKKSGAAAVVFGHMSGLKPDLTQDRRLVFTEYSI